jgi:hypothetical protein
VPTADVLEVGAPAASRRYKSGERARADWPPQALVERVSAINLAPSLDTLSPGANESLAALLAREWFSSEAMMRAAGGGAAAVCAERSRGDLATECGRRVPMSKDVRQLFSTEELDASRGRI